MRRRINGPSVCSRVGGGTMGTRGICRYGRDRSARSYRPGTADSIADFTSSPVGKIPIYLCGGYRTRPQHRSGWSSRLRPNWARSRSLPGEEESGGK